MSFMQMMVKARHQCLSDTRRSPVEWLVRVEQKHPMCRELQSPITPILTVDMDGIRVLGAPVRFIATGAAISYRTYYGDVVIVTEAV